MNSNRMMFAMDRDTETGHAIQGKSMLPFIFVNVDRMIVLSSISISDI